MGHTCHTYRSQIWVRFSHSFWQWLLWWCECLCMGQWSTVCDSVRQIVTEQALTTCRAFCTEFDPELFSHRAYVKFFYDVCDKSAVFDILRPNETIFDMEMEREGGNREKMRKCRESISLHFLIFSPIPPHFLILSPFPLRFLFISSQPGCKASFVLFVCLLRNVQACKKPDWNV